MASAISAHLETNDVLILDLLAEGASPAEAAAVRVERDVACRRYERGSSELEMAFDDYRDQARRVLAQAERTAEALFRVNASGRRDERPRAAAGPRRRGRS